MVNIVVTILFKYCRYKISNKNLCNECNIDIKRGSYENIGTYAK